MNGLWRLIARCTSGHEEYDRTIHDNAVEAIRSYAKGDKWGYAYWGMRAISLSLSADRGHRWNASDDEWDKAQYDAAQLMGDTRPYYKTT